MPYNGGNTANLSYKFHGLLEHDSGPFLLAISEGTLFLENMGFFPVGSRHNLFLIAKNFWPLIDVL